MDSFTCENAIKLERDYENNQNDFIIVKITSEELFCINIHCFQTRQNCRTTFSSSPSGSNTVSRGSLRFHILIYIALPTKTMKNQVESSPGNDGP